MVRTTNHLHYARVLCWDRGHVEVIYELVPLAFGLDYAWVRECLTFRLLQVLRESCMSVTFRTGMACSLEKGRIGLVNQLVIGSLVMDVKPFAEPL